ncbi:hypothetical protein TREMEDRAFT_65353 [Tremella mesenterica DSM 1558]|uniref:uncharacterized protein n=1 Tax=Tremella mesenterica (strain ATCC 24925 / CBS 8224 / DSM 1558 / NBRC 9311 / NRRL Y-6157 / RJB 2259-6 / UBC 559-6) TaxID=578456 RepID=UPI00032C961B|nr:uncharacterized protein TREMEDRAFT_65353 [Tremella mesenterica DSM 1558]EIW66491.1 hypothetical protein TREMEDRAFT_65353 [Tremella mesenterica DSM 1558]
MTSTPTSFVQTLLRRNNASSRIPSNKDDRSNLRGGSPLSHRAATFFHNDAPQSQSVGNDSLLNTSPYTSRQFQGEVDGRRDDQITEDHHMENEVSASFSSEIADIEDAMDTREATEPRADKEESFLVRPPPNLSGSPFDKVENSGNRRTSKELISRNGSPVSWEPTTAADDDSAIGHGHESGEPLDFQLLSPGSTTSRGKRGRESFEDAATAFPRTPCQKRSNFGRAGTRGRYDD